MNEPPAVPPRRLCVAPMMQRTDRHFRFLMRSIAPHAWLYTEMTTTGALLRGHAARYLSIDPNEHPVALQLGGGEARELARAARLGEAAGFAEINLNVGCPSGRVQEGAFGAALMLDAPRVAACVSAMRSAVGLPVTVKTRLGVDDHDSSEFLCGFIAAVASAGCRTFILHARKAWLRGLSPKENREVPPLDYARVHRMRREFPMLEFIVNGGLSGEADAVDQLRFVDGVMLGRAAYDRPLMMRELDRQIFARPAALSCVADILEQYVAYIERRLAEGVRLKSMTRHLFGVFAGRPGGRRWRRELSRLPDTDAGLAGLKRLVAEYSTRVADGIPGVAA